MASTILQGNSRGEMITRKANKTAIGRCKEIDGLILSATWKEAEDRVSCRKRAIRIGGSNGLNNIQVWQDTQRPTY